MTLRDDLIQNRKIDSRLRAKIAFLDASVDDDTPLFSAFIRASASFNNSTGIHLNQIVGGIYTAHTLSLNNLKTLVDEASVKFIEGSQKLFPDSDPCPE